MLIALRRVLLVLVAAFIAWRMTSYGVSNYYFEQAAERDLSSVDRALAWNPQHPGALYRKAQIIGEKDLAGSASLLKQSFLENPSSSYPLLALAGIARNANDQDQAGALVDMASRLMPANPPIQIAAGHYWASRGDLEAAMSQWSQALVASPTASDTLFPILLKLAEEPRTLGLFKPLAESPPSWWEGFFQETARRALNLETVRTLYFFRRTAVGSPLTSEEREHYIRRLQSEGKITEAYLVWVNGLDKVQRESFGLLHNGSFELEPSNSGFDWHVQVADQFSAAYATIAGIQGKKALRLVFKRWAKRFEHVFQPLFLDPGAYRVTGIVRTESLDSQGGLKWVVRCLLPEATTLGESDRFLGSGEWREFSFDVQVPNQCAAQEVRLVSAGRHAFEHKMTGGIWFDGMSIRKVLTPLTEITPSAADEAQATEEDTRILDNELNVLGVTGVRTFDLGPPLIESLGSSDD